MQSGRQSHINQKSKEAWFYEHLPVPTSYRLIFYWRKFATEPGIRDAFVAVLQFSLNFLCSKYTDWCFNVHQVRIRSTPFTGKKETSVFWNMRQLTVKKRNDTSLTHKAKLKITVCPYSIMRILISTYCYNSSWSSCWECQCATFCNKFWCTNRLCIYKMCSYFINTYSFCYSEIGWI